MLKKIQKYKNPNFLHLFSLEGFRSKCKAAWMQWAPQAWAVPQSINIFFNNLKVSKFSSKLKLFQLSCLKVSTFSSTTKTLSIQLGSNAYCSMCVWQNRKTQNRVEYRIEAKRILLWNTQRLKHTLAPFPWLAFHAQNNCDKKLHAPLYQSN